MQVRLDQARHQSRAIKIEVRSIVRYSQPRVAERANKDDLALFFYQRLGDIRLITRHRKYCTVVIQRRRCAQLVVCIASSDTRTEQQNKHRPVHHDVSTRVWRGHL